jgi:TolB-like protein/Tfp pilus assembly protein PilF
MKTCPKCHRDYPDETLNYCLDDGETLVSGRLASESPTAIKIPDVTSGPPVQHQVGTTDRTEILPTTNIDRPRFLTNRTAWLVVAFAVAAAFAGIFLYRYYFVESKSPVTSVAVLPFRNRGGDPDSQYLSEGLAESLIYRLSQLENLKVSPTSSVFKYEDKEIDPVAVGKELGVSAVLSGRIVQHGDNLTISANLVDVRDNRLLWGEQYDRKMSELLVTQREIAREIVSNLKLKVPGSEQGLAKHYTENNEAYQLYLKARFYWNKRTPDANNKTIEYMNQAIAKDPGFALAYSGLADAYAVPNISLPADQVMPKAKAAAMRALELDDSLAEAHTSLARVLSAYEWDWAGAEKEFQRAIDLNPNYPLAHEWYGGYLASMGKMNESVAERKRAVELDPLSPIANFEVCQSLFWSRDYQGAIEQCEKAMDMDPSLPPVYIYLPAAYAMTGRYDDAIAKFKMLPSTASSNESSTAKAGLAYVYAITGRKPDARGLLSDLLATQQKMYIPATNIAVVYAGLGEKETAFKWLDTAVQQRSFQLQWLKVDPRWDDLRNDPRFGDLLKRVGLQ